MIIYVDLDNVLCTQDQKDKSRYTLAEPIIGNIDRLNNLYDDGHIIAIWTARGTGSKLDFSELTKQQLDSWGVKYHFLKFGKPNYDVFIDDRAFNSFDDYEKSTESMG